MRRARLHRRQQPTVTGVNLGSADISASAAGFFGDKKTVQVAANLSFLQQTLTIGVNGTQELTLNFSGQAPAGGLTVNVSSTNTGVATVPTTVTIPATKSSVTVPVTAVGVGSSVIHASAASLADTTATVNVVNIGTIGLPANQTVGLGQTIPFPVTLPFAAPAGGVTVALGEQRYIQVNDLGGKRHDRRRTDYAASPADRHWRERWNVDDQCDRARLHRGEQPGASGYGHELRLANGFDQRDHHAKRGTEPLGGSSRGRPDGEPDFQ